MGRVQRLGGEACTYYLKGRCSKTRSPEKSARTRCTLLEARRKVGAQTLDRLERIKRLGDPADREVARRHVVQKNLKAITSISCDRFVPSTARGALCRHQFLVYCVLLLPKCKGRCDDFMPQRDQVKEPKEPA